MVFVGASGVECEERRNMNDTEAVQRYDDQGQAQWLAPLAWAAWSVGTQAHMSRTTRLMKISGDGRGRVPRLATVSPSRK